MSCKCKRCGSPNNDCDFAICYECFLDQAEDDLERNMILGGRFYPSVKEVKCQVSGVQESGSWESGVR